MSRMLVDNRGFKLKRRHEEVTVHTFWQSHGVGLQSENGPGSFKHDIVVKMGELHQYIAEERDTAIVHRKILDILGEQGMHVIQFQSCLDEFNRYLGALRLLDTCIMHVD
jgi:hypothetical protein